MVSPAFDRLAPPGFFDDSKSIPGLDILHVATCRQMMVRTAARDLWPNGPGKIRDAWVHVILWGFLGYACLSSFFALGLPWLIYQRFPHARQARRVSLNPGWDVVHHVLCRLAAINPNAQTTLSHDPTALDPQWQVCVPLAPSSEVDLRVRVQDDGERMTMDLRWSRTKASDGDLERLRQLWDEHLGAMPKLEQARSEGIKIQSEGNQLRIHAAWTDEENIATVAAKLGHFLDRAVPILRPAQLPGQEREAARLLAHRPLPVQPIGGHRRAAVLSRNLTPKRPTATERFEAFALRFFFQHSLLLGFAVAIGISLVFVLAAPFVKSLQLGAGIFMLVVNALLPTIMGAWWLWRTSYGRPVVKPLPQEDDALVLENTTLRFEQGASIELAKPFQLFLTRPDETQSAVCVELRQRAAQGADVQRLAFKVPVEPDTSVADLPRLDSAAPWLGAEPVADWVWPAIASHASLHGSTPSHTLVSTDSTQTSSQAVEAQQSIGVSL